MRGTRSSKQHRRNKTRRGKRVGGFFSNAFTAVQNTASQLRDTASQVRDTAKSKALNSLDAVRSSVDTASQAAADKATEVTANTKSQVFNRFDAVSSSVDRMTKFSNVISRLRPDELNILLTNMLGNIDDKRKQEILSPN